MKSNSLIHNLWRSVALFLLGSGLLFAGPGHGGIPGGTHGATSVGTSQFIVHQESGAQKPRIGRILGFFVDDASAATAGVNVYISGNYIVTTDATGTLSFTLQAGTYQFMLQYGNTSVQFDVTVPVQTVVTISEITYTGTTITYVVDDGSGTSGGGDTGDTGDSTGKTTLCHKNKKTISVGYESVSAHQLHGDTMGECPN
ncbi:MAG: hypothetical protein OEQ39_16820 [Gammaproteobacteria bacterium]|nr:hypothetical protein [Gammaproteobacteria bacterium]